MLLLGDGGGVSLVTSIVEVLRGEGGGVVPIWATLLLPLEESKKAIIPPIAIIVSEKSGREANHARAITIGPKIKVSIAATKPVPAPMIEPIKGITLATPQEV